MQRQINVLNLFVEFRVSTVQHDNSLLFWAESISAGMIKNLKTRDITLIPTTFRAQLYGLGYPRQPLPWGNFIERLYVKT